MSSDTVKFVRIHRRVVKCSYSHGKRVYKYSQLMLTIPSRFKGLVEPFIGQDLSVTVKKEDDSLIIEAKIPEAIS